MNKKESKIEEIIKRFDIRNEDQVEIQIIIMGMVLLSENSYKEKVEFIW
jgi:hypothetical protein